ncbi:MAG: hypothetical protein M1829_003467 [Trizodia sp. TS-e1964]|nr:MAG: hypothetical protein M1829_003467 [Trizodia sp. TS-e1964]
MQPAETNPPTDADADEGANAPLPMGFLHEDLVRMGAIEMARVQGCTLSNDIHPLFHPSSFENTPPQMYAALRPALQLASHLLTHAPLQAWWVHLLVGPKSWSRANRRQEITPLACLTPAHWAQAARRFQIQQIVVRWERLPHDLYACTQPHNTYKHISLIMMGEQVREHCVSGALAAMPLWQQMAFHFFFAVDLMHELAHAMLAPRCSRTGMGNESVEPFLGPDAFEAEAGAMWENGVFGTKVQTINYSLLAEAGILAYPYRGRPESMGVINGFWAVRLDWVNRFFREESWVGDEVDWMRMQLDCAQSRVPYTREVVMARLNGSNRCVR